MDDLQATVHKLVKTSQVGFYWLLHAGCGNCRQLQHKNSVNQNCGIHKEKKTLMANTLRET